VSGSNASCSKLNPASSGWSPVMITIPTGMDLQINLANNLSFGTTKVPTSLVIVGQLGGGLGNVGQRTTNASPLHDNMGMTWPIPNAGGINTPPAQPNRVQSFSTEVAAGSSTPLTWRAPRPGTYLMESSLLCSATLNSITWYRVRIRIRRRSRTSCCYRGRRSQPAEMG
jgi:hypothetical protein